MVAQPVERAAPLFPRQRRFVMDPARFPGYVGGIGSGKSFAGAAKAVSRVHRPGLGMVAAPTYPMLRDATMRSLFGMLTHLRVPYAHNKSENIVTVLPTKHEILCRSLDNPDTIRGPNLEWAWVDEASLVPREAWNIVVGRIRVGAHPQAWATFTPKGRNWCWEVWERDADPDHPLYRVRTEENPELPTGFAASLGYTGQFANQELGGEFVAFEGLVYPQFERSMVQAADTTGWRTALGVDVGTNHPTAALTVHAAGDGRRHVSRELYRRGMTASEIVDAVAAEYVAAGAETVFIDPSAAAYVGDLASAGLAVVPANHDLSKGIPTVMTALTEGFTVDPSCVNTIAEFESYHYPDGARASDRPVKERDDAMDALRYALMGLHDGPVLTTTDYFGEAQRNEWDAGGAFAGAFTGWS